MMAETVSSQTHSLLVASLRTKTSNSIRARPSLKVLDTVFDASSIVLTTLEDISKIPATPLLAYAARIAIEIFRVAQVSRLSRMMVIMRLMAKYRLQDKIKKVSGGSQRIPASWSVPSSIIFQTRQSCPVT